jgi:hypothetical protein
MQISCPEHAAKREVASKITKSVLEKGTCAREEEKGTMQLAKVTATASPWFVGSGKNLVVRK